MTDSIFLLRCVDCDAQGLLSRLWIRASVEVGRAKSGEVHRYVECMNCGARLKSRSHALMETVDDDEWQRFVGEDGESSARQPSPASHRAS